LVRIGAEDTFGREIAGEDSAAFSISRGPAVTGETALPSSGDFIAFNGVVVVDEPSVVLGDQPVSSYRDVESPRSLVGVGVLEDRIDWFSLLRLTLLDDLSVVSSKVLRSTLGNSPRSVFLSTVLEADDAGFEVLELPTVFLDHDMSLRDLVSTEGLGMDGGIVDRPDEDDDVDWPRICLRPLTDAGTRRLDRGGSPGSSFWRSALGDAVTLDRSMDGRIAALGDDDVRLNLSMDGHLSALREDVSLDLSIEGRRSSLGDKPMESLERSTLGDPTVSMERSKLAANLAWSGNTPGGIGIFWEVFVERGTEESWGLLTLGPRGTASMLGIGEDGAVCGDG
jgi:hypothetical protein